MGLIVQKFGGSSVADAAKVKRAAQRAIHATQQGDQIVLVVSAMGKTTDTLIALAHEISRDPPKRELDMLLTTGEQVAIALMAMAIAEAGEKAISLTAGQVGLVSDSMHTQARIRRINRARIERELARDNIVICAGFQGIDEGGEITTLGRGASDTTALALAAVLGAEICEIFTDVDGIYTADPRLVGDARKIERISYDEMLEMASLGAGVMHSRAIEFGKKYDVPIHVRHSLSDEAGTMIVGSVPGMEDVVVRGATLKENLASVVLTDLPNQPGVAARIFGRIAERNIIVDDIMQNIHSGSRRAIMGFTIESCDLSAVEAIAEQLLSEWDSARCEVIGPISKLSVIGIGMRSHSGVARKMFETLAAHGINIRNISTSEIVISCMVDAEKGQEALRVLHAAFCS